MSNAASRAQAVYNVLASEPDLTTEEIAERLPALTRSQLLDAIAKLFRDGVGHSEGPPVGELGVRRYSVRSPSDHPTYQTSES